ncbi:MAG: hypothetical protein KKF42_07385, partial [Actinobacteria bacterium]|nr:hypothetical protein [Actinomycetota bacterium]
PEQQAAYYKSLAKKHEKNSKALLKSQRPENFDQIVADAEAFRKQQEEAKTPDQKALDAARAEALAKAEAEAAHKFLPLLVRAEFARRMPELDDAGLDQLIEDVGVSTYFKDGEVDMDRIDRVAARFAPPKKDEDEQQGPPQFNLGHILAKTQEPKKGASTSISEAEQRTLAKYQTNDK